MPQYLSPGVYVEETSFRTKTIEGVSTSTPAFVGPTRGGPTWGFPEPLTCLADFERIYGSIDPLNFDDVGPMVNYVGQAVRAFFDNGGSLLYVSRTWLAGGATSPPAAPSGFAQVQISAGSPPHTITWQARHPGTEGNVTLSTTLSIGNNGFASTSAGNVLRGATPYDLVWISPVTSPPGSGGALYWAESYISRTTNATTWRFHAIDGSITELQSITTPTEIRVLRASVQITYPDSTSRTDVFDGLTFDPRHPNSLSVTFAQNPSNRQQALTLPVVFQYPNSDPTQGNFDVGCGIEIFQVLLAQVPFDVVGLISGQPLLTSPPTVSHVAQFTEILTGGSDGLRPTANEYQGMEDPSNAQIKTGLVALQDVTDVAMVAAPGSTFGGEGAYNLNALQITESLIAHCEAMRYRMAILDTPDGESIVGANAWRGQIDSSYAALYYPWIRVLDPITDTEINLPPSGFVAGICARSDSEVGVHKAPANEIVQDALGFEVMLNKAQQDVLNPNGVNCFRFFEGRGYRLWGARTATSDSEWKYVNLRRYMNYLKHSIDNGTQYVVFENNGPDTWAKTTQLITDFLFSEFSSGRLLGTTKEQAFFVRCDLTTMTQSDLDNGRLVCLIGVALFRPAEYVIFRIGQFTASSSQ
jgi:phage tail sheath protein FI